MNQIEPGTLYLVPTPIGNLSDMSERAVNALKGADIIAAEDTRHTRILLNHFHIEGHLVPYHEHNKKEAGPKLIEHLLRGEVVAQCSDAGMPVISDPGADLVQLALQAHIPIVPLPGPNAALTALIASGLDARQFVFIGFLPKITAKKKKLAAEIEPLSMTLIFYEAPHRLKETLDFLIQTLGNRKAVLARELTKKFETFSRGTLAELRAGLDVSDPRGEYVVLVEGKSEGERNTASALSVSWKEAALQAAREKTVKKAAREVADAFHLSRRTVYQYLLENKDQSL